MEKKNLKDKLEWAIITFGAGLFIGGFVLKWQPVQGGKAYLLLQSQLGTIVVLLLAVGFGFATILKCPWLHIKKILIKGKGTPIAILYYGKGGQMGFDIISYSPTIHIGNEEFHLKRVAFSHMGMPGYILHEGCVISLDWNTSEIEAIKERVASEIETNYVYTDGDGKSVPAVPRAFTLKALSPISLREVYRSVYNLALAHAETKAEKVIKLTMILAGTAVLASVVAAYYSYYGVESMRGIGAAIGELTAIIKVTAAQVPASTGGAHP